MAKQPLQQQADTDLLRDLGALLEQTQKPDAKVTGNIEVAAVRMQAVKQLIEVLSGLYMKKRELLAGQSERLKMLYERMRTPALYPSNLGTIENQLNELVRAPRVEEVEMREVKEQIAIHRKMLCQLLGLPPS